MTLIRRGRGEITASVRRTRLRQWRVMGRAAKWPRPRTAATHGQPEITCSGFPARPHDVARRTHDGTSGPTTQGDGAPSVEKPRAHEEEAVMTKSPYAVVAEEPPRTAATGIRHAPPGGHGRSLARTTATGQCAWCSSAWLTEPSSRRRRAVHSHDDRVHHGTSLTRRRPSRPKSGRTSRGRPPRPPGLASKATEPPDQPPCEAMTWRPPTAGVTLTGQ